MMAAINRQLAKDHDGLQVHYVYDCWTNSQDAKRKLYHHWGEHVDTLRDWTESDAALNVMKKLHRKFSEMLRDQHAGPRNLLFLCKSGRHRSVAAAAVAKWNVGQSMRFRYVQTLHLSSARGWHPKFCTTCEMCMENADGRVDIKKAVKKKWLKILDDADKAMDKMTV